MACDRVHVALVSSLGYPVGFACQLLAPSSSQRQYLLPSFCHSRLQSDRPPVAGCQYILEPFALSIVYSWLLQGSMVGIMQLIIGVLFIPISRHCAMKLKLTWFALMRSSRKQFGVHRTGRVLRGFSRALAVDGGGAWSFAGIVTIIHARLSSHMCCDLLTHAILLKHLPFSSNQS